MSLNIIVKSGKPLSSVEMKKELERRENARITYFNREGYKRLGAQSETFAGRVLQSGGDEGQLAMAVPQWLDGKLMDMCRQENGHTDWRRDRHFLKRTTSQPEMRWLPKHYGKGLSRMLEDAR